jgi:hypothetical protein
MILVRLVGTPTSDKKDIYHAFYEPTHGRRERIARANDADGHELQARAG